MLTPEQKAELAAWKNSFQGSQEEYNVGFNGLMDKFKIQNEQIALAKKIEEAKAKKVTVPANQMGATAGTTSNTVSNGEDISLAQYLQMTSVDKMSVPSSTKSKLIKEKKDRELMQDYVLNPEQPGWSKSGESLPQLSWKDLRRGVDINTGVTLQNADVFNATGDQKLREFADIHYRNKGIDPEKIRAASVNGDKNQEEIDFINSNLYETVGKFSASGGQGGGVYVQTQQFTPDYIADPATIEEYPNLFNDDGTVKSKREIEQIKKDLNDQNKKYAEITQSPFNREIKREIEESFKSMMADLKIEQDVVVEDFKQKTESLNSGLMNNYPELLDEVTDINNDGDVNIGDTIVTLTNSFNERFLNLQDTLSEEFGITMDEINTFKPSSEEEKSRLESLVSSMSDLYDEAVPLNNAAMSINNMAWQTSMINENQRIAQVILGYGDVAKLRGEYTDGALSSGLNNIKKGWTQGELNDEFWKINYGITDLEDPDELKKVSETIALLTAKNNGVLTSRVWEDYNNATTVAEQMSLLKQNPIEILFSLFGNSMSQFISTGDEIFIPIVGGSTLVGAGVGATAGGVGAVPGALTGLQYGLATWQGITALNMEVGNAYQTVFTEAGLNLESAEDIIKGFNDPELMSKANEIGLKRGIPIALMNLVGAKAASSLVNPLASTSRQVATTVGTQLVLEPVFEGTGETAAQLISGEGFKATEVFNEMIGGQFGTGPNMAVKMAYNTYTNAAGKQAIKLKNLDNMINGNYNVDQIEKFTARLLKNGKITEEDAKVVRQNAEILDATNNEIKNNSKKGKVKTDVKARIADLIKNKKVITDNKLENTKGGSLSIKQIDGEIAELTTNDALKTEDKFTTIKDYQSNQRRSTAAVLPFLKSLGIDSEVEVIEINNEEDYNKLPDGFNVAEMKKAFEDGTTSARISSYTEGSTQYVFVNNENIKNNAAENLVNQSKANASVSVAHEILHAVLDRSFNDTQMIDLSNKLTTYLDDQNSETGSNGKNISSGVVQNIKQRLKVYGEYKDGKFKASKQNPKYTEAMYAQEVFTLLSDEMSLGNIQWDRQDKALWQRVANDLTDYLKYKLNIPSDVINSADIQTGEQAFNFIKNFNKSFFKGKNTTARQVNSIRASKSQGGLRSSASLDNISDLDNFITNEDGGRKFNSKADFQQSQELFEIVNEIENTDLLEGLIRRGVNQTYLDLNPEFVREVKERISDKTMKEFDPSKNESFFGWLTGRNKSGQSIIDLAKGDIQNKNKKNISGTSLNQETSEGQLSMQETIAADQDSAMVDLENEDLSVSSKPKIKEKTFSEKLNISPSLQSEITNSVINILDPDNSSLPSITQDNIRKKLEQAFSKELMKKVRPILGRSIEDYKKFLNDNFKSVWDKIPQSSLNKRFPQLTVVVKERMGASASNVAERNVKNIYAGNTLRIKDDLTKQDFVDYFTGESAIRNDKVRSRKQSLAAVLATELAKDEVNNVMMENPNLAERWIGQQELLNDNLKQNYLAMLALAVDRATLDSNKLRSTQVVETAESLGISQVQLSNLLNSLSLEEIADQQPIIYDSIISSFNEWVKNTVKKIGIDNDGFVKVIGRELVNSIGDYNNSLKNYIKEKKYNWSYKFKDLEGQERYIYRSEEYDSWLTETLEQIKYMPPQALAALKKVKNQNYNWLKKMHVKESGSTRGGGVAGMVYNADGSLISEERQKNVSQEEYAEAKEISKQVFKKKYDAAIDDAIKNNKATEETKQKWSKFNPDDMELGNKGAATMSHILSVYRNIANKPWSAKRKAKVMSRTIGPRGKASLEAGLNLMDAYHSSLNDWVNNEVDNGRNRSEAMQSIFANMQMTTNAVYSARAYASFTSFYFENGPQNIDNKFKGYKGEHVQDSSSTTSSIFMSMLNNEFNENIDGILDGFEQSAMLESDTKKLDAIGGKNSPLGNLRFLLDPKLGKKIYNLDGINKFEEVLETYSQYFKTSLGTNLRIEDDSAKFRASQGPRKGISVWDFDDTLATTKSMIGVEMPDGKKTKIDAETFAKTSDKLSSEGAKFDFSEFEKVMKGRKGPMFQKALDRNKKFGNENVYILTARPQASATAIQDFLKGIGLDIPLKNITGLADGRPEAKAEWVEDKVLEGYNDFYFADDVYKNVKAVQESLNKYDIKSKTEVAAFRNSMNNSEKFNSILQDVKGVDINEEFSDARAKMIGKRIGKYSFWIPPSAEDFAGLLYAFYGKGKVGEAHMEFFKQKMLKPFSQAMQALTVAKNATRRNYNGIRKNFSKSFKRSLNKESNYKGFTNQDAVRVYMWVKGGYDIPDISKTDINKLIEVVENNPELKKFGDQVFAITGKGYVAPSNNWTAVNIAGDLQTAIRDVNRKEYLQEWIKNKNEIFSKENLNKIEALYGSNYREAMEDMLYRMETGSNRPFGKNRLVNGLMNWINNSVGAIMFFNARSAVLQTISAINFINFGDNNPIAAAKALANQKQYWKDFSRLFNSDFLQQRRSGNKTDISASEISSYVSNQKNPMRAAVSFLLEKGFLPTQIADSFAIASGGSTFFRNRTKTYQAEGMSLEDAEAKAFLDFAETAEEAQQSSRPDRISQQQAGPLGRVILAFANTPMQYARIMKKSIRDLANGRGDAKTNISKIVYYGAVQNLVFNALQKALFSMLYEDEEEDEKEMKAINIVDGMADSLLRGLGFGGAAVAAVKSVLVEAYIQKEYKNRPDYNKAAMRVLTISPPIQSKLRKINQVATTIEYDGDEIWEKGFSLDNPGVLAGAKLLSATTNVPADRVVQKLNNLKAAVDEDTKRWQSIALIAGWDQWSIGMNPYEKDDKVIIPDFNSDFDGGFESESFDADDFDFDFE